MQKSYWSWWWWVLLSPLIETWWVLVTPFLRTYSRRTERGGDEKNEKWTRIHDDVRTYIDTLRTKKKSAFNELNSAYAHDHNRCRLLEILLSIENITHAHVYSLLSVESRENHYPKKVFRIASLSGMKYEDARRNCGLHSLMDAKYEQ